MMRECGSHTGMDSVLESWKTIVMEATMMMAMLDHRNLRCGPGDSRWLIPTLYVTVGQPQDFPSTVLHV